MVQPQEVITLEHCGGIPPRAWARPVASRVKMANIIAVTAKRLRVIFIFFFSLLIFSRPDRPGDRRRTSLRGCTAGSGEVYLDYAKSLYAAFKCRTHSRESSNTGWKLSIRK